MAPVRIIFGIVEVHLICQARAATPDARKRRLKITRETQLRVALFEPDIPQNAGAILRLCACLDVSVDLIEPAGFILSDRHLRRAGMDYIAHATLERHISWDGFIANRPDRGRLVLLSTHAATSYTGFAFEPDDTLLLGRESAGVPDTVRDYCDGAVRIPISIRLRSLNVATAASMVLGEALRQTRQFPEQTDETPNR